jgi:hypothetical protein
MHELAGVYYFIRHLEKRREVVQSKNLVHYYFGLRWWKGP